MRQDSLLEIRPQLTAHLEKSGYVLVDMRFYRRHDGENILEILVDRHEGGITLDECARLNGELGSIIERSGIFWDRYTLDVSSPGMDRPLATAADFRRVLGWRLRFFLREAVADRIEWEGVVDSADESAVSVTTTDRTIQIPLDKINKAKQVIS
jgi:ribosome maturation factor RimP